MIYVVHFICAGQGAELLRGGVCDFIFESTYLSVFKRKHDLMINAKLSQQIIQPN